VSLYNENDDKEDLVMQKKLLITLCLVLVLGTLSLVGEETIKIGAILDYTGPVAELGPKFEAGIRLALEEVNYEVAGRPIELIIEDGATSVGVALDKFKKLVDSDGINICIGPLMGDCHLAIAPYAAESKVLATSLINGMYEVAKRPDTTYLIYPTTCWAQTYWFGQYVYNELGYRTMITIGANYAGKIAYANGAADGFKAAGGIVTAQLWPPVGTQDYSPYISTMVGVDVDVILYALEGPGPVSRFLYQATEAGLDTPMVTITQDGDYTPEALAELGDIALGIPGEATYSWQLDNPENKAFVDGIMAKTGKIPSSSEQNAYTLTKIILAGLDATGGDDSFDVLWPAILALKLDTPAGPVSFEPNGVAICDAYVTQAEFSDGEYRLSAPLYVEQQVRDPRFSE
jgi:branched-chain amino acid transport system substrate-binding protein